MSRLKEKYGKEISQKLKIEFGIKNRLSIPRLIKVVVNSGVGELGRSKEGLAGFREDLAKITGQMPAVQQARVSVASFNLRRGMPVGLKVTLRGLRMYDFLDKLFSIVLPRLRDFRGIPLSGFDSQGNYTLGIEEHSVFPEVGASKQKNHGIEITIVSNSKDKNKGKKLLELLGMPFEKEA